MQSTLKAMATAHTSYDGAVTFYMLPYRPLSYQIILRKLSESGDLTVENGQYWAVADLLSWMQAEAVTVDIEFENELPDEARHLQMYWQHRNGSPVANWQLAQSALTSDALEAWAQAYEATRAGTAAVDEQEFDDPKADGSTSNEA